MVDVLFLPGDPPTGPGGLEAGSLFNKPLETTGT